MKTDKVRKLSRAVFLHKNIPFRDLFEWDMNGELSNLKFLTETEAAIGAPDGEIIKMKITIEKMR